MAEATPVGFYVIVSGPPASGKSTVAAALAASLDLPLLAKDTIKQGLLSVLPAENVDVSRVLGRAAVAALLAVATDARVAVLDSVWHRSEAAEQLHRLPGAKVEVFCSCDQEIVGRRYRERARLRGPGHFDRQRTPDELWNSEVAVPLAGGWPVLEVDTSNPVDIPGLTARIERLRLGSR